MANDPTRPMPSWQDRDYYPPTQPPGPPPRRRRRRRWPLISGISLVVVIALLVAGDRIACAIAENDMASQIQSSGSLNVKPNVDITGFPFLTQLANHDFNHVVISASNVSSSGTPLVISTIHADLYGMHISGNYQSATVNSLTGIAVISYSSIENAASIPQDVITLGPGPQPDEISASINLLVTNATVTAQVTKVSSDQFRISVANLDGVPGSVLGNLVNYTYKLPKLPAGMQVQSVIATKQGVQITVTAQHTVLSQ
jgi:hypothetical protein